LITALNKTPKQTSKNNSTNSNKETNKRTNKQAYKHTNVLTVWDACAHVVHAALVECGRARDQLALGGGMVIAGAKLGHRH